MLSVRHSQRRRAHRFPLVPPPFFAAQKFAPPPVCPSLSTPSCAALFAGGPVRTALVHCPRNFRENASDLLNTSPGAAAADRRCTPPPPRLDLTTHTRAGVRPIPSSFADSHYIIINRRWSGRKKAVRGTRIAHIWFIDGRPKYVYLECIINIIIITYIVQEIFFSKKKNLFKLRVVCTSEIAFFFRESAGFFYREKFTIINLFFRTIFLLDVRKTTKYYFEVLNWYLID